MFFFDFGVSIYFFFFNLFLSGHGYTETQMGLLTGAMAAGNLIGAIPAAALIRRKGLRCTLVVCLFAAPTVLCARTLSTSFPSQVLLAFLTGLSLCLWAVVISPITAALTTERERPLAFSLVFSLGIGVGAAGALAGSRMPEFFSRMAGKESLLAPDQLTLIAACCIAALALIPAARLRDRGSTRPPKPGSLSTRPMRRMLPAIGIWGLVTGSFAPFGNVFLASHVHLPLHNVGTVFSISQLCQVAAVLCAPLVFRRLGVPNGVFTMQMGTAACFMLLAFTVHPLGAATAYVVLMGMQYMGEPGIYSMMMNMVPEEARGSASASMALVLGAAQLVAAACGGWAFKNLGYPVALGMIAMIAVIAGLLFRTVRHVETRALIPCTDGEPR
jgi:MFS family permease